ncbi:hypothetical protein EYA88_23160 [Burkholderia pseudomallei]|nr:hypothetical protein EYA88_23160 [Burkholderia pseudomallei]
MRGAPGADETRPLRGERIAHHRSSGMGGSIIADMRAAHAHVAHAHVANAHVAKTHVAEARPRPAPRPHDGAARPRPHAPDASARIRLRMAGVFAIIGQTAPATRARSVRFESKASRKARGREAAPFPPDLDRAARLGPSTTRRPCGERHRMNNPLRLIARLLIPFATLAAAPAASADSQALDAALDCSSTGHAFVAPLVASGAVRSQPMHVEANSMNAFRTNRSLSAYGFSVYVVLGYQANDPLFAHGDGEPIGDWAYGVVVRGSKQAVEAKVRAAGSQAVVKDAFPFLTAIVCTSP